MPPEGKGSFRLAFRLFFRVSFDLNGAEEILYKGAGPGMNISEPFYDESEGFMAKQLSFTKYENEALHAYRQKLSSAESSEDVRKFFLYTTQSLFRSVFDGRLRVESEDITLIPEAEPCYRFADRILSVELFDTTWRQSDLSRVVNRFAESAASRMKHLEKHPEKTDRKIRK